MTDDDFNDYEQRLIALEILCPTKEERELNKLVLQIVRAIRATLWLINGGVKYLAAPIGIFGGLYLYGQSIVEWISNITKVGR